MRAPIIFILGLILAVFINYNFQNKTIKAESMTHSESTLDTATFGAGCFWCVEAVFQRVKGVEHVVSGYTGGHVKNPTYQQVSTGNTGHAEVAQITFDPSVISYSDLLEIFWETHDPTTLNRQGNDVGTQYRSAVFYHNQAQKQEAERIKAKLNASGKWKDSIVTEISPLGEFYKAENYHQNYYNQNSYQPYCQFMISPKLQKFEKKFSDKAKK